MAESLPRDGVQQQLPTVVENESPVAAVRRTAWEDTGPSGMDERRILARNTSSFQYHAAILSCKCSSCTEWAKQIYDYIITYIKLGDDSVPNVFFSQMNPAAKTQSFSEKWETGIKSSICKLILFSEHDFQRDHLFRSVCDLALMQEDGELTNLTVEIYPDAVVKNKYHGKYLITIKEGFVWDEPSITEDLKYLLNSKVHLMYSVEETVDVHKQMDKLTIKEKVAVPSIQEQPKSSRLDEDFEDHVPLGEGGYGKVYKAKHKIDGEWYAIKVIEIKESSNVNAVKKEARLLSKLNHDSIVRYHTSWIESFTLPGELSKEKRYLCIKMEHCQKGTLDKLLQRRDKNIKATPIEMFKQIVCAISCLHSQNITHGDLKQNNIFVDENHQLKLGDFGLAEVHKLATTTWDAEFRSPRSDKRSVTKRDDIFSLGVILHAIVTDYRDKRNPVIIDEQRKRSDMDFLMKGDLDKVRQPKCTQLKEVISILLQDINPKIEDISKELIPRIINCSCQHCQKDAKQNVKTGERHGAQPSKVNSATERSAAEGQSVESHAPEMP